MKINPGVSNQLSSSTLNMYNNLTVEELNKALDEIYHTKELIAQLNTYELRWSPKIGLKRLSNIEIRKIKSDINGGERKSTKE